MTELVKRIIIQLAYVGIYGIKGYAIEFIQLWCCGFSPDESNNRDN